MESIHFYKPVELLINTILTGKETAVFENDLLVLHPAFIKSLKETGDDQNNPYFLSHIECFLKNCTRNTRETLLYFFIENSSSLSAVYLLTGLNDATANKNLSLGMNLMLTEFVENQKQSNTLILALYFYIENLSRIKLSDSSISKETYQKILKYNSIVREPDNV